MKTKITNNIKAIILGLALTIGMGYAAAATFTGPACGPEGDCNTPAPVNIGGNDAGKTPYSQLKTGLLTLMSLITPDLTVRNADSSPVTVGQVLTATDVNGKAEWRTVTSASVTPGTIVTCSKTVNSAYAGMPGIISYSSADCGGYTVDSTYYGATKGVNISAQNGAQGAAQVILPFRTLNASEGGPAIQLYGSCSGPSGCIYNVSSVYIKLGGGSAGTPAGLVMGGYSVPCAPSGGHLVCQAAQQVWGAATSAGCPAAYSTGGGSQVSGVNVYLCLTK